MVIRNTRGVIILHSHWVGPRRPTRDGAPRWTPVDDDSPNKSSQMTSRGGLARRAWTEAARAHRWRLAGKAGEAGRRRNHYRDRGQATLMRRAVAHARGRWIEGRSDCHVDKATMAAASARLCAWLGGRRVAHAHNNNETRPQPAGPANGIPRPLRGNDPARELASGNSPAMAWAQHQQRSRTWWLRLGGPDGQDYGILGVKHI
jgi:hypothetical protein